MADNVAPYVGAWIETVMQLHIIGKTLSHPMWVRGLKLAVFHRNKILITVAPYVGAWIETKRSLEVKPTLFCRTLCGCVD